MTFRRPHLISVKCEEINITDIIYSKKGVCVNYKNVNVLIYRVIISFEGFLNNFRQLLTLSKGYSYVLTFKKAKHNCRFNKIKNCEGTILIK